MPVCVGDKMSLAKREANSASADRILPECLNIKWNIRMLDRQRKELSGIIKKVMADVDNTTDIACETSLNDVDYAEDIHRLDRCLTTATDALDLCLDAANKINARKFSKPK